MSNVNGNGQCGTGKIGYVVKRYPRFSETFIVNEILAHEAAGADIEIFALRPTVDTHFQADLCKVAAPVHYLESGSVRSAELWKSIREIARNFPAVWSTLAEARLATAGELYQGIQLARLIAQTRIRHLHAHFATSATTVARVAASIAGIEYSFTAHAKDIFHESVNPDDLQHKIDNARCVITVSDFNQHFLEQHFHCPGRVVRIYNGLNLHKFRFFDRATGENEIIAVGRLVAKKGFGHLVRACRLLADQGIPFRCRIAGGGELESVLSRQIEELQLGKRVQLTGPVPQNQLTEMIRSASVMVAPCVVGEDGNRDGLPTVITESLALGTPCIATDVTGIPEIIQHGRTGLIVSQGSAPELANAIRDLFVRPQLGCRLARNGRRLIEEQFNIATNTRAMRELFPEECLSSSQNGHTLGAV